MQRVFKKSGSSRVYVFRDEHFVLVIDWADAKELYIRDLDDFADALIERGYYEISIDEI